MSAFGASRISPLRCAGAMAVSFVVAVKLQTVIQPSATPPQADAGGAGGLAALPGSVAARAITPTRESLAALSPADQITALTAALPQMEVADIIPLVEHLLKARDFILFDPSDPFAGSPDPASPLLRALFTRWAALDAAGLMAYVESGPLRYDYNTRHLAVLALVEVRGLSALEEVRAKSPVLAHKAALELLLRDPGTLEALLPLLAAGADRANDGYAEVVALAGRVPPDVLLRFAAGTQNRNAMLNAMNALAATDFARAAALAKSLPGGPVRDMAMEWVLNHLSQTTSEYAATRHGLSFRAEYEALPEDSPVRKSLTGSYAALLTRENPDAALKWAHTLPDARQRFEAVVSVCASLFIGIDGGNTFLSFYGREGDAAERLTRQFADAWMAAPEVAAKAAHIYDLYPFREWHIKDPAASEAWLATVKNPDLLKTLMASVTLAPHTRWELLPDMASRLDYAADYYYGPAAEGAKLEKEFALVPEWREAARLHQMEKNLPGTAEWETLTPDDRRALSAAAIRESAKVTGQGTGDPPAVPADAGQSVRQDWLTLFNSLPPEERSLGAYYETGAAYIKQDEIAASQWVDSLPPGAERDAAATALVEHLVRPGDSQDGEAAFVWAATMSGETERARYTAEAARAWAAEDPAAARAAVQSSTLPEAEKSALLRVIPEGGAR